MLTGRTITEVRHMTRKELRAEGWPSDSRVLAIVLDSGTIIFPSRDEEGNGPGEMFGISPVGAQILCNITE